MTNINLVYMVDNLKKDTYNQFQICTIIATGEKIAVYYQRRNQGGGACIGDTLLPSILIIQRRDKTII